VSPDPRKPKAHTDQPPDTRPYLCIPYWTTPLVAGGKWDTGQERPLPAAVVSYACESIHAGAYAPGQPLDVAVTVRNSGGGNSAAIATVVVYWADPTVGFAKPTFFAASVVAVRPGRSTPSSVTTPTMTATIPATAPAHICLVVVVSHPQDRAGTTCDPINDRHWAQRNLQAVQAGVGAPMILPLTAANPFRTKKVFELRIGPADERRAELVAQEFETRPGDVRARVRILDAEGAALTDSAERVQTSFELGPLGKRPLQLMIELDNEVRPGQSSALEAELHDTHKQGLLTGSLGIVLLSPDRG
jgi:hypothetical protein